MQVCAKKRMDLYECDVIVCSLTSTPNCSWEKMGVGAVANNFLRINTPHFSTENTTLWRLMNFMSFGYADLIVSI